MGAALRLIGVVSVAVGALSTVVFSHQAPPLADVLAQAGRYIAEYELAFSAVVSEERYQQTLLGVIARGGRESRTLRSDVLLILGKETGWVTFRDVYEVDGRAVRDRQDRLAHLILKPTSDAAEQARRIAEEGARFNLGPVIRTINTPTMALQVLRKADQHRSAFRLVRQTWLPGLSYLLAREYRAASRISARPTQIEGYATYTNFRRFSVDTTTVVR